MTKKKFRLGIAALTLVFGMAFVGCNNPANDDDVSNGNTTPSSIKGTWISTGTVTGDPKLYMAIIASDGNYIQYIGDPDNDYDWKKVANGTYPNDLSPVTITYDKINERLFTEHYSLSDAWRTWEQLDGLQKAALGNQKTQTITLSGNQFAQNQITFKRQPVHITDGKLTITGLAAYNNNYVFAHTTSADMEAGKVMLFGGRVTSAGVKAVQITNGEAVIPLYEASIDYESSSGEISGGFSDDLTLNMDIVIMNTSAIPETWVNHPGNWVANDEVSITFTEGIAALNGGDAAVIDWDGDD